MIVHNSRISERRRHSHLLLADVINPRRRRRRRRWLQLRVASVGRRFAVVTILAALRVLAVILIVRRRHAEPTTTAAEHVDGACVVTVRHRRCVTSRASVQLLLQQSETCAYKNFYGKVIFICLKLLCTCTVMQVNKLILFV